MLRCIIKLLLVVVCAAAIPEHVVAKDKPSITSIWPTTWYIGLDLAKTCMGWCQKTGPAYEIHGSIDCSRILLSAGYGWGQIQRDSRQHNGSFAAAYGKYFRVGLDYNFLTPALHHNQFFIGLRYARSFFDFQLKSTKLYCNHLPDKPCDLECKPVPIALQHSGGAAIAHWWEIVAGGKAHLIGMVSIGCTARYKFSKKIENDLHAFPFDIPGFGLAEFDHAFGYSLYILLRIPLQKSDKVCGHYFSQKSVT
ncbi:MAG: DUF6048 family protein [Candidatus Cardinium sp.]|uniref:DUF6048 family protein n=1 Tax=Cardinium endosymbiont of Dermatophagoides farinae TaxID=2597823 RepID=UPI0011835236|nr:DUF6048 family protein [Cardinium endosymbiont of Dermatophagoides farinae]TSJ81286.1 hypothetical protein FPG78_04835 [Cardinium endosymbiont of Dermatophagoides farinae]UWW97345.1 MAG: DUF6048 family protein [Candidatus Cardinium sp.]